MEIRWTFHFGKVCLLAHRETRFTGVSPSGVVRGWYEPCIFEQWMLFEEHSLHTYDTMRRRPRDGRSGLPSTTLM